MLPLIKFGVVSKIQVASTAAYPIAPTADSVQKMEEEKKKRLALAKAHPANIMYRRIYNARAQTHTHTHTTTE